MSAKRIWAVILLLLATQVILYVPSVRAGPYRDYATFISTFKSLAVTYPSLMSYETVGRTVEGRDIVMFKIGNPSSGRVLFDGAIHGWESLGGEVLYCYAKWLLTSSDPLAKRILERDYTLLVPAVDVDRYNVDRQNAHGVDLNRNFASNWQYAESSNSSSDNYRGPTPLSEPESQTMVRVFNSFKPAFYVNLHFPGGKYYAGSTYGNGTYYSILVDRITSMSTSRSVTPYAYSGEFWGAGFAMSDAARTGITSFMMELTDQVVPYADVATVIFPKFLPTAIVLSQEAEKWMILGDVNKDGVIDSKDYVLVTHALTSRPGMPTWNPDADVNKDGTVDVHDYQAVRSHIPTQL